MNFNSIFHNDWNKPVTHRIGGLTHLGFYDKWNYLLVCSHQGRSVFDCNGLIKISRNNIDLNPGDWNESQRTIKGIGPLENKNIHCVGIWGGKLIDRTEDGWIVEIDEKDQVKLNSLNNETINIPMPLTELRAVGFSHDGKLFIYATSSEIMFYTRKSVDKKFIMSKLPLLEKNYMSPREYDDEFMRNVILLACSWSTIYWINLTLNWFDEGFKIDRKIINELERLLTKDNLQQDFKHRVFAIVKKWKFENYIYIDVIWIHDNDEDPKRLISELDEDRFEQRKLEYFGDNTIDFADEYNNSSRTLLGLVAVSSINEINREAQFKCKAISREKFEELWFKCVNNS